MDSFLTLERAHFQLNRHHLYKIYKTKMSPLHIMILLSRNKIKQNGCWTADFHFRAVLCSLATPECQTLSPPLPSTSPWPLWQLLAYLPIQHVMRKLTDRFLSSQWKKAQTSLWGTELHRVHITTYIFKTLMWEDWIIIAVTVATRHYFDCSLIGECISLLIKWQAKY